MFNKFLESHLKPVGVYADYIINDSNKEKLKNYIDKNQIYKISFSDKEQLKDAKNSNTFKKEFVKFKQQQHNAELLLMMIKNLKPTKIIIGSRGGK